MNHIYLVSESDNVQGIIIWSRYKIIFYSFEQNFRKKVFLIKYNILEYEPSSKIYLYLSIILSRSTVKHSQVIGI